MKACFFFILMMSPLILGRSVLASGTHTPSYRKLEITLSESDLKRSTLNERMKDAKASVRLTGSKDTEALVGTRGQTSIKAPRKNFSVEIKNCGKKSAVIGYPILGKQTCKMLLTSMWQDRGYVSTKIGLDFMAKLGVSEVRSEYVELFLNGASRGLYLLSEDPKSILKNEMKATWIAKRKGSVEIEKAKIGQYDGIGQLEIEHNDPQFPCVDCAARFNSIRKLLAQRLTHPFMEGSKIETELRKVIDLDQMMTFMAINRLLRNGDYADEFFIYQTHQGAPLRIFGWDYDDLFKNVHFLSRNPARLIFNDPLNYNSEASIFVLFAADPHLRRLYHRKLKEVLIQASEAKVEAIIGSIDKALSLYSNIPAVATLAQLDDQKVTHGKVYTSSYLKQNLESRKIEILSERKQILLTLSKEGT